MDDYSSDEPIKGKIENEANVKIVNEKVNRLKNSLSSPNNQLLNLVSRDLLNRDQPGMPSFMITTRKEFDLYEKRQQLKEMHSISSSHRRASSGSAARSSKR